jgi:hypothetical protein
MAEQPKQPWTRPETVAEPECLQTYSGSKWLERSCKVKCSPLGRRVADILGYVWRGLYHLRDGSPKHLAAINWADEHVIEAHLYTCGVGTFDGSEMTELVILCHALCIRLEINKSMKQGCLRFFFTQRIPPGDPEDKQRPYLHEIQPTLGFVLARMGIEPNKYYTQEPAEVVVTNPEPRTTSHEVSQ